MLLVLWEVYAKKNAHKVNVAGDWIPNTPSGTLMASSLLAIDVAFLIDACVTPASKNGY